MPIGQNIVEQQYELENVPMDRLMSMAERPDGIFPQYLVLTELERRNKMKSAYDMQKASMEGNTTVAEDLIMSSSETPAGINALGTSSSLSNQSVDPAGGITQMMAGGGEVEKELPSAFRNIFTPVTDTGNKAVDNTIGMLMNIPDFLLNTFDGAKGTSLKDTINLARGYPELVHEDSYQFELENFLGGRFDKYKDRLKKDGVPSKLYQEGGSVYSNPYFGDADPEEVKKLQEKMPGLSTEDAVAIILGIDTSDITKGFAEGGSADENLPNKGLEALNKVAPEVVDRMGFYGGGLADIIGGAKVKYAKGPDGLPGMDKTIQRQNAQEARARANKIIADLEARYGVGNIPRSEYEKVKDILQEANLYEQVIEERDVEQYKKDLKAKEEAEALGVQTEKLIVPDSERKRIEQEKKDREDQAQAIMEMSSPDFLAEEMKRYAGILGLPSEEERRRDKTTAMLLGLGSSIANATNLGDIGKSFPGIFNAMQGIDKQETKDKMGILNLLATQQKTNTLSRKDQIKALNDYLTSRQKALEMPGTDAKAREQIEAEIKQIEAALSSMLGTQRNTTQSLTEYLKG